MRLEDGLRRSLFVIPSIEGGTLLARMLPTIDLPKQQVVVLDQGSLDDTAEICAEEGVELIQLGRPHTYTEACNIGVKLARDRGAQYLFVSNNDIKFVTDVAQQLLREMLDDPALGIVAPSQVLVDEKLGQRLVSYRVQWNLESMEFTHDFAAPDHDARRLEADFCELTCSLVRMSVIDEIGFLDDEYGFYHEDADFGFRLRQAGYVAAYLPQAQIEHFVSSTFSAECESKKRAYIERNKRLFAEKHLGYGSSIRTTDRPHPIHGASSTAICTRICAGSA